MSDGIIRRSGWREERERDRQRERERKKKRKIRKENIIVSVT